MKTLTLTVTSLLALASASPMIRASPATAGFKDASLTKRWIAEPQADVEDAHPLATAGFEHTSLDEHVNSGPDCADCGCCV